VDSRSGRAAGNERHPESFSVVWPTQEAIEVVVHASLHKGQSRLPDKLIALLKAKF
jgi:hypothetical protein